MADIQTIAKVESSTGRKTYYESVLLKVRGVSQYNTDQISFENVDDFWQVPRNSPVPPIGTVAHFKLSTNPKSGGNAKPGSMYRDIVEITRASDAEKASLGADPAPQANYNGPRATDAADTGKQAPFVDQMQQRIALGMAFNNLTARLAAPLTNIGTAAKPAYMSVRPEWEDLWQRWFSEASRGLPLTPVVDEDDSILDEVAALDAEVDAAMAEDEEVEDLPF